MGSEEDPFVCPICYNSHEEDSIYELECTHSICRGCIEEWIKKKEDSANCPICRQKIDLMKMNGGIYIKYILIDKPIPTTQININNTRRINNRRIDNRRIDRRLNDIIVNRKTFILMNVFFSFSFISNLLFLGLYIDKKL